MKRLLMITAALLALTGSATAAATFEQVAVSANYIAHPDIQKYRILVAFVLQNDDRNINSGGVTCSLFVKGKLAGTATGFVLDVLPLAKLNGFADGGLEDFKPDSAECTLQVLVR